MKRVLALCLSLTLLLFAGCSASGTAQTAAQQEPSADQESAAQQQTPAEDAEPAQTSDTAQPAEQAALPDTSAVPAAQTEEAPEEAQTLEYTLPLYAEPLEFSMFYPMPGAMVNEDMDNIYNYPFWIHVREELNVAPEFVRLSESAVTEKFALLVAAGDLTDVVSQGHAAEYSTGLDLAVEDEVYADLTYLVEDYAPNFYARICASDQVRKELVTEGGRIVSMSSINDKPAGVSQGMLVNTDRLAETGYALTNVAEDWIDIFRAMQANGTPHPAATTPSGNCCNNAFYYAFGTTGSYSGFMVDLTNDQVYFDALSDGFKAYVEFFRTLYAEGLIDPNFYNTFGQEYFMDGTYATWMGNYQDLTTFPKNYGVSVTAVPPLHLADSATGEPKVADYASSIQMTGGEDGICFNAKCAQIPEIMKFFDWCYSEEGANRLNYGFEEGVSYEILEDGSLQLKPEMLDRDPVTNATLKGMHTISEGWGYLYTGVQLAVESAEAVAANELWSSADADAAACMAVPSLVSLTAEESEEAAAVLSDISTYVESTVLQWYTCVADFDDAIWADYVSTVESMGVDEAAAIYQTAYERYQSK